MVMTPGETIDGDQVRRVLGNDPWCSVSDKAVAEASTLREFKESAERAFLVEKLRKHSWNVSKTAEVIKTPRSNLYKKLEHYRIKQESDG